MIEVIEFRYELHAYGSSYRGRASERARETDREKIREKGKKLTDKMCFSRRLCMRSRSRPCQPRCNKCNLTGTKLTYISVQCLWMLIAFAHSIVIHWASVACLHIILNVVSNISRYGCLPFERAHYFLTCIANDNSTIDYFTGFFKVILLGVWIGYMRFFSSRSRCSCFSHFFLLLLLLSTVLFLSLVFNWNAVSL